MLRSFDDLDQVVGLTAIRDEFRLFEAQLFERCRIAGIGIKVRTLQRMQVGQLLLRLGSFCPRDQRHEIWQCDQHKNTDDNQHNQKFRQRKCTKTKCKITIHKRWVSSLDKTKVERESQKKAGVKGIIDMTQPL